MKTAFVTGSIGFVGRHMAQHLHDQGWQVWGSDPKHPRYTNALKEFRDASNRYDLVVHCAYHVGGRAGIDGDRSALAKNLELDAAMFDWAVRTGQPRVVYFSSSAVYPVWRQTRDYWWNDKPGFERLQESWVAHPDPMLLNMPDADYGWAKLCGERLADNARALGVNVHVLRPFSGYGEDQSQDYPFPAIVARARQGDLTVWGPPGQTRDWIHIDDIVAGTMAVVEADFQQPVNLCTGIGTDMGQLAHMVAMAARPGEPLPCITYDESKPTGVLWRVGDPSLMNTIYTPKISLEEGIRRALV